MTSLLVFFHVSRLGTLTQLQTIYSRLYFHMCISASLPVRNTGIAVFASIQYSRAFNVCKSLLVYVQCTATINKLDKVFKCLGNPPPISSHLVYIVLLCSTTKNKQTKTLKNVLFKDACYIFNGICYISIYVGLTC